MDISILSEYVTETNIQMSRRCFGLVKLGRGMLFFDGLRLKRRSAITEFADSSPSRRSSFKISSMTWLRETTGSFITHVSTGLEILPTCWQNKAMEHFVDSEHGASVMLAGLVVLLALHLIAKVGEFLWELLKNKDEKKDRDLTEVSLALQANSEAVRELRVQIGILQVELTKVSEVHHHTQKLFSAVKYLAGPKWPRIRKHLETEKLP